jgi:predicted peptidase
LRSVQGILPVNRSLWTSDLRKDEATILTMMDELSARYRIDPGCVLITGFSAGGYPMYYVVLRHPERFAMAVARNCNSDMGIFEGVKLSDEAKRLPVVVFWGKDDLAEIQQQSWEAVRWFGEHGFKKLRWKKYPGGHLRRPENAYGYFRAVLPAQYRR